MLALVVLFGVAMLLFTSGQPAVDEHAAPTPAQVQIGQDSFHALKAIQDAPGQLGQVHYGNAALNGISVLLANASGYRRTNMVVRDDRLVIEASLPFLGRWLNFAARIDESKGGFPPVGLTVGHVSLPPAVVRPAIRFGHWVLHKRNGLPLVSLDDMVRGLAIADDAVTADLHIVIGKGLLRGLIRTGGDVDSAATVAIFCRLGEEQHRYPSGDFVEHLRRAFRFVNPAHAPEDENRAAFVALSMLVVHAKSAGLAGIEPEAWQGCRHRYLAVKLGGRTDLPKHWALSAAMGAALGTDISQAMGEWKELSDSLPKGSGFSFVDLAADRAGFKMARMAANPEMAAAVRQRLATATAEQILPSRLLANEERLSEAAFVREFRSTNDPAYLAEIARIDAELAKAGIR